METTLKLYDKQTREHINPYENEDLMNELMTKAGLNIGLGFEDFGIQSDGQLVVFDKCGNFGYLSLDPEKYNVHVQVAMSGKSEIKEYVGKIVGSQ